MSDEAQTAAADWSPVRRLALMALPVAERMIVALRRKGQTLRAPLRERAS